MGGMGEKGNFKTIIFGMRNFRLFLLTFCLAFAMASPAQNWGKVISGLWKTHQAMTITDAELAEMVKEEVEYMDKQNKVLAASNAYTKRLKRVMSGINSVEGITLNFKVYKTNDLNAFACPDGSVRVFSGLMDLLSDDELLGVLGHEIGHVALKHSKKAWRSAMMRSAASDAIGVFSDTWSAVSDSFLGTVSSAVLSAAHSKVHEVEADDYGYDLLKRHGKNPWAMVKLFEKLKKMSEENNSKYTKWLKVFASHPDYDTRINHLKSRCESDGYSRP